MSFLMYLVPETKALILGILVNYDGMPLMYDNIKYLGLKDLAGDATNGSIGIAVMDYHNSVNENIVFVKTTFFFSSGNAAKVKHVTLYNKLIPLVTVLDQSKPNDNKHADGFINRCRCVHSITIA